MMYEWVVSHMNSRSYCFKDSSWHVWVSHVSSWHIWRMNESFHTWTRKAPASKIVHDTCEWVMSVRDTCEWVMSVRDTCEWAMSVRDMTPRILPARIPKSLLAIQMYRTIHIYSELVYFSSKVVSLSKCTEQYRSTVSWCTFPQKASRYPNVHQLTPLTEEWACLKR